MLKNSKIKTKLKVMQGKRIPLPRFLEVNLLKLNIESSQYKRYIKLITMSFILSTIMMQTPLQAQETTNAKPLSAKHEFSIYGMTGYSGLQYDLNPEAISANNGGTYSAGNDLTGGIGIGYTYSFSSKWGLVTGLEFASFATTTKVDNISGRDPVGYSFRGRQEAMDFLSEVSRYKETQSSRYIHIPLMLQYIVQTAEEKYKWYMAAGAKFGFSLSGHYEAKADRLTTSAYLPETNQTFTGMPEHGLLTISNPSWEGTQKQGLNVALSAEAGLRISLSDKWRHWRLYTGIYIDYGLTNVSPPKTKDALVGYQNNSPEIFSYNSIITAKQPSTGIIYVDRINLIAIGVKLKLGFRN
jgi:hypothetical protein